MLFIINCRL
jgi:hypothetical protein